MTTQNNFGSNEKGERKIKFQSKNENHRQQEASRGLLLAGGDGLWPHLLARVVGVPPLSMTFIHKSLLLPPTLGCWSPP